MDSGNVSVYGCKGTLHISTGVIIAINEFTRKGAQSKIYKLFKIWENSRYMYFYIFGLTFSKKNFKLVPSHQYSNFLEIFYAILDST